MEIWKNCTVDVIYFDERPACLNGEGYIVRLSDSSIEVAYDDEDGAVCYSGRNNGDGHFNLFAKERNGEASLHCFPKSHYMEGYWKEGEVRGMWRIHLK